MCMFSSCPSSSFAYLMTLRLKSWRIFLGRRHEIYNAICKWRACFIHFFLLKLLYLVLLVCHNGLSAGGKSIKCTMRIWGPYLGRTIPDLKRICQPGQRWNCLGHHFDYYLPLKAWMSALVDLSWLILSHFLPNPACAVWVLSSSISQPCIPHGTWGLAHF